MKGRLKIIVLVAIAGVVSLAIVVGPIIINECYKRNEGYITVWGGSDMLAYFGAIIGAIGTISLGLIAWQQNGRILKLEENVFLAANAGFAVLTEVDIINIKSGEVLLDRNCDQILLSQDASKHNNQTEMESVEITCKFEPFSNQHHVALVRVDEILLVAEDKKSHLHSVVAAGNSDKGFTQTAISKDFDRFRITLNMTKGEKSDLFRAIGCTKSALMFDINLSIMTQHYVETTLRCRAFLESSEYDIGENCYSRFKTTEKEPPMCFWRGASVLRDKNVEIKPCKEEIL